MQVSDNKQIANSYPRSFFSFQATLTRFPFLDKLQHSREPVITTTCKTPRCGPCIYGACSHKPSGSASCSVTPFFTSRAANPSYKCSLKATILVGWNMKKWNTVKAYSCIWCNTCSISGKHYCCTHILILSDQHTACTLGENVKSQIISLNTWRLRISHVGLRMAVKHSLKTKDGAQKKGSMYKEGVNSEGRGGVD